MVNRVYSVYTSSRNDKIFKFVVSDALTLDEANDGHPDIAEFLVSKRYTEDEQRARALTYANYMNKIVEATRTAYEQNQLIDLIKA
jgi:hypothetical protein